MVELRVVEDGKHRTGGACLGIGGGKDEAVESGVNHGSGAHGAGRQRDIKSAAEEAVVADGGSGRAHRHDFSMGSRVEIAKDAVLAGGYYFSVVEHDGADGYFAGFCGLAGLGECGLHGFKIVDPGHNANAAGCFWVMACSVSSPQTRSTEWMPMTSRSGKTSARIFRAVRSLGSWKVGTS